MDDLVNRLPLWLLIVLAAAILGTLWWALKTGREVSLGPMKIGGRPAAATASVDEGKLQLVENMPSALLEMVKQPIRSLSGLAYVGNLELDALKQATAENLDGARVRLLLKAPNSDWVYLDQNREQAQLRRQQLFDNRNATARPVFERLADREVVRWYSGDPVARGVLVEPEDGEPTLFLGLYSVEARRGGRDYTGSGRPVVKTTEKALISDFRKWFDFTWDTNPPERHDG